MEILSHPVIAVILLLGALIFFHELGHFLVGKAFGIAVETFSIGFGPSLLSFRHKETQYRLSAIPLGGYVKFFGSVRTEEVPPELKGREFYNAPVFGRILTVAAGPVFNFVLAILVFAILGYSGIQQPPAIVGQIMPDSPAEKAGLKFQDRITKINGIEIYNWKDLQREIEDSPGQAINLEIERGQEREKLTLVPDSVDDEELARTKGRIGISPFLVPSVVTVIEASGPAAQAGLQTGMRVTEVETSQVSKQVKYWVELEKFVETQLKEGQNRFIFNAFPVNSGVEQDNAEPVSKSFEVIVPEDRKTAPTIAEILGITDAQLTIGELVEPVEGLQRGDHLEAWNGAPIDDLISLSKLTSDYRKPEVELTIRRDGSVLTETIDLKPIEMQRAEGKVTQYTLPVRFWGSLEQPELVTERYENPLAALWYGIRETAYYSKAITGAVIGLFTGELPLNALGGPIAIAKVASDSVKLGWQTFITSMAWLSINLGLLNLLPIPVLDGGQLVLLFTEGALRRPLSDIVIENYQKIGFVMVLALVVMATYNDLGRFWASMLKGMTSIF